MDSGVDEAVLITSVQWPTLKCHARNTSHDNQDISHPDARFSPAPPSVLGLGLQKASFTVYDSECL